MGFAASGPGGMRGAYGVGRARRPAWRWAGRRAAVTRAPRREVCAGPAPPPPATAPGPAGCGLGLSCGAGQTRVRAAGISAAAEAGQRRKLRLCSGSDAKRRGRRVMGGSSGDLVTSPGLRRLHMQVFLIAPTLVLLQRPNYRSQLLRWKKKTQKNKKTHPRRERRSW